MKLTTAMWNIMLVSPPDWEAQLLFPDSEAQLLSNHECLGGTQTPKDKRLKRTNIMDQS